MKKLIILFCLFLLVLQGYSQNVSGEWKGYFTVTTANTLPSEITVNLVHNGYEITGTLRNSFEDAKYYEYYRVTGSFDEKNRVLHLQEENLLGYSYPPAMSNVHKPSMGYYKLSLQRMDKLLRFVGTHYEDKNVDDGESYEVWFQRTLEDETPPPPPVTASKQPKIKATVQHKIEVLETEKDSIRIELKDNADIDNDIVTVYFDNEPIIHQHKLTHTPAVFYISLGKNNSKKLLKMVAESMGSVPPCTALMTIITAKNRYQLNLSSTASTVSAVELVLKEE